MNSSLSKLVLVLVFGLVISCRRESSDSPTITLATSTSTQESGLLDVLVPEFERQTGIEVKVVAVGSGQALELGRRGDADVILSHAPNAEEEFMAQGHGVDRRPVMHNDFVLVGPTTDPAGVKDTTSIVEAFARIADTRSTFVSRADESGTHKKEQEIWRKAQRQALGDWHIRVGAGMTQVLRMANQKRAYTLTDRSTWLTQREAMQLVILVEYDPLVRNEYSVLVVNAAKHPRLNQQAAQQFAEFLLSQEAQKRIAEFGVDRFGQPLYFAQNVN